jgi:outer membrane protein assembly factor BamB
LNIATNFSGKSGQWAYAESPLVDGDLLVCTPGGERATLVALDKKSGQVIWQSAIPGGDEAAYASITVVQAGGIKQYVQFLQNGLVGVEAKTGKFLWRYDVTAKGSPANIPTPVSRSGLIYSAAAMGTAGAVRLRSNGSGVDAEQAYINKQLPAAVGGAIELNGNLYGTSGGLTCANFATGEVKWQGRGVGAGSILYADGRLYLHSEKNGEVALVEATPEEYREKGRFTLPDRPAKSTNKSWAYPVVANGRLYFREADSLWCYDIQQ